MIYSTKQELTLSVPLTLAAHQHAQQFYQQHSDPLKAKQVYLNTLAVEAVCTYLSWLGVVSDLRASDSWDPIVQTLADAADLELPGQGKLECRPVLPEETTFYVPPEISADRIGYLPVLLDAKLETATLLGFMPGASISPDTSKVSLTSLQSLDLLFDSLKPLGSDSKLTHLSRWLEGAAASGWQAVEALLGPQPEFSFRGMELSDQTTNLVIRGKLLELTPLVDRSSKAPWLDSTQGYDASPTDVSALSQYAACRVALIVSITPSDMLRSNIWVKLCPIGGSYHLPEDLEVRILDDQEAVVMEAQSRQTDMLQLNFRGTLNEQFSVEVALNDVSLVEKFVI